MTPDASFGQIVKERRAALGLTQAELANRVGCASITIRRIEGDNLRPSVQMAELLALSLNIPETEQLGFVRLARQQKPTTPIPIPTPSPGEIGLADLTGRAVKGFQLGELIGSGGFGVVYRAVQPSVNRDVAIKIILPRFANQPDFIRRFESEAHLVARLEHPHIVPLYDYWREPDAAYLIMRLLRGGSLDDQIKSTPLTLSDFQRIVPQICSALYIAHRNGVIHRDIKPANVMLDEDKNAYLADFGIAKNLDASEESQLTQGGAMVGSPAYISPEQILAEPIQAQSDIYCLGIMLFEILSGQKPFPGPTPVAYLQQHLNDPLPLLQEINPEFPSAFDDVIQKATAKKPEDRYQSTLDLLADLEMGWQTAVSTPPTTVTTTTPNLTTQELAELENPYRGLRAFTEADAGNFHGRNMLVQELLGMMADGSDLSRFVAVVGPSGSGKSSVVKAGLIPALRRGGLPNSDNWFVVDLTPSTHPWEEVEAALLRIAVNPPDSLLAQLRDGPRGLQRAIRRILPDDGETELVMVIDQFEELFTLVEDEEVRAQFLEGLVTAVLDPNSRLHLIITLRADFTDRPLQYVDFGELMRKRTAFVLPLTPNELTNSITKPITQLGMEMEPALVSTIIREVGDQPGMLPLMQYALTELFEERQGRTLTLDNYKSTGGVLGALARRADEIYNRLNDDAQETTRQLFLRLITLGEGVEDTRRRVLMSELESLTDQSSIVNRQLSIVNEFGKHRLLTFDHDPVSREATVEVAHEALLREWPRLREWLSESREDVRRQRLLAIAATQWQQANQDNSYLLRGSRLVEFESWGETTTVALTENERVFLDSSTTARDQRRAEEAARQQRELETAQKLADEQARLAKEQAQRAEEQTKAAQSLRQRALFLTGALVLAAILAVAAFGFARSSNNNANLATTREAEAFANLNLAATNEANAIESANIAAARESEAEAERETAQNEANIRATAEADAAQQRDEAQASERAAQEAYSLSLAANARQALEAKDTELALLLALAANNIENPPLISWRTLIDVAYAPAANKQFTFPDTFPQSFDLLPGGEKVVVGTESGEVHLIDLETESTLMVLTGHESAIYEIAASPDGKTALSGAADSTLIYWDLESGESIHKLAGQSGRVGGIAFLPDGKQAISGADSESAPGEIILWDLENGMAVTQFGASLEENREGIRGIGLLTEGKTAVVGLGSSSISNPKPLTIWDIESRTLSNAVGMPSNASINDVAISPDQQTALLASSNQNVYLFDLTTNEIVQEMKGHTALIESVAYSPDGKTAVSAARDNVIIWWEIQTGRILYQFTGHTDDILKVDFLSPNQLISSAKDGSLRIWDLYSNWELDRWSIDRPPNSEFEPSLSISPQGDTVYLNTVEQSLIAIDYETGESSYLLKDYHTNVIEISISANGRRAVTGMLDGTLLYWNLQTGSLIREMSGHTGAVWDVDISEDGLYAISGSVDGQMFYWDLATGRILRRMTGHLSGAGFTTTQFLPGAQTAVSASSDGTMLLWDLQTGEQIKRLTGLAGGAGTHLRPDHVWGIQDVSVAPGGHYLISSGLDQTLLLWDIVTGDSLQRFSGSYGYVYKTAFGHDESTILSTTQIRTMILWDIEQAVPIREYVVYDRPDFFDVGIYPVMAVHPDGETAVTTELNGPIIKWRLTEPSPDELLGWIQNNRLLREFTCLERQTYQIEPLCDNGVSLQTSVDLLASVQVNTSSINNNAINEAVEPTPLIIQSPNIEARQAVLGENRGELQRNEFDIWTLEASAGDKFSVQMVADNPMHAFLPGTNFDNRFETGALDSVLYIIGPDGTLLEKSSGSFNESGDLLTDASIDTFIAPETGTYRIEARSLLDDNAGEYTLVIEQTGRFEIDPEILADYVGHYLEGPWEFDLFFSVEDEKLKSFTEQTGELFEMLPISETEFIVVGDGSLIVFTRDDSGQVDGYDIWLAPQHPPAGQWYRAEKLDD